MDIKEIIAKIRNAYTEAHAFDIDINFLQALVNIQNEYESKTTLNI